MIIDIDSIIDKAFPAVTDRSRKYGDICYYAQSDVTCYVLRGEHGDILIDTGMPQVWHGLPVRFEKALPVIAEYLGNFGY